MQRKRYPLGCFDRQNAGFLCLHSPDCRLINIPGYLERTSVLDFVEAAPTGVFFSNLDLPDKRINVLLAPAKEGQVVCCAGPMLLSCAGFTPCSAIWDVADVSSHLKNISPNPKYRSTLQRHNS